MIFALQQSSDLRRCRKARLASNQLAVLLANAGRLHGDFGKYRWACIASAHRRPLSTSSLSRTNRYKSRRSAFLMKDSCGHRAKGTPLRNMQPTFDEADIFSHIAVRTGKITNRILCRTRIIIGLVQCSAPTIADSHRALTALATKVLREPDLHPRPLGPACLEIKPWPSVGIFQTMGFGKPCSERRRYSFKMGKALEILASFAACCHLIAW